MHPPIAVRTERDALRQSSDALQRVISAFVENAFVFRTQVPGAAGVHALRVAGGETIALTDRDCEPRLALLLELRFAATRTADRGARWTVRTLAYAYRLTVAGDTPSHLVAYHWHPHIPGISYPHIHVLGAPSEFQRLHIAVPHCTPKHVLSFAMRDFGVQPIRDDWLRALDETDAVLLASMEWARQTSFLPPER